MLIALEQTTLLKGGYDYLLSKCLIFYIEVVNIVRQFWRDSIITDIEG